MTCALPVLLSPVFYNNGCYIDGGIVCNYPLNHCLQSGKKEEEMIGFKNNYKKENNYFIDSSSNMFDFIMSFMYKAIFSLSTDNSLPTIKNEIHCDCELISFDILKNALYDIETRRSLFQNGVESTDLFLSNQVISKEKEKEKEDNDSQNGI